MNVITPNGDGVNDILDYSALAGKPNLVLGIFDRYGV
ncbi:T9SS type B sorting domain-containing protein, partial [Chryseobacterium kimseyorum]